MNTQNSNNLEYNSYIIKRYRFSVLNKRYRCKYTYFPSSFSISKVYVRRSKLRPSPHFNLRLFGAYDPHSSLGGLGGRGRVVTLTGELKAPTPIPLTACIRTLSQNEYEILIKNFHNKIVFSILQPITIYLCQIFL